MTPPLDHFGILAPFYERVIRPPDVARLRTLLALPIEGLLLDVGGGTGRVSCQLLRDVGGLAIVDLSWGMLIAAQSKGCQHPLQARAEALPFADGSFSRVLAVDALHHFAAQDAALAELWRVLAPGGRLVIEEPDIRRFRVQMIALMERLAGMKSRFIAPDAIHQQMTALGAASRVALDGRFTAWIVADKPRSA